MGRLRAGQALGDLSDSMLVPLLQWFETTGESGRWVEVHQEITRRLHSRNTCAPDQHDDARPQESSDSNTARGAQDPAA